LTILGTSMRAKAAASLRRALVYQLL